jgi:SAM-dependent methyltransferase
MLGYLDYLAYRAIGFLKPHRKREDWEIEIRRLYSARAGMKKLRKAGDHAVLAYESDGKFDYELYRRVQTIGNKGKIERVFVAQENIAYLCRELEKIVPQIDFVLCHGTRNAAEQKFFKAALSKSAEILGTEISDNAEQFPMTIEWDFHEVKPEWLGAVDIVYSNSFDHSYDPDKLFAAWLSCLRPNGVMVLEWSRAHGTGAPSILDPFNIGLDGLLKLLGKYCEDGNYRLLAPLTDLPVRQIGQTFVLVQRAR